MKVKQLVWNEDNEAEILGGIGCYYCYDYEYGLITYADYCERTYIWNVDIMKTYGIYSNELDQGSLQILYDMCKQECQQHYEQLILKEINI